MKCRYDKTPSYAKGYKCTKSAVSYSQDIVSCVIPANRFIQTACKRFLEELEKSKEPDYPYYFDKVAAEKVCAFAETLPHVKGQWARGSLAERHFVTEKWQRFILGNLFGWKRKKDNRRRFKEAYIEVPRKNGKSFLAAVIGLYMLLCDNEPGAEVYCGATTEKQAYEVFKPALQMVRANKPLRDRYHITVKAKSIELPDGSVFEPIIGTPKDGASPHCSILDEYHEHQTDGLYAAQDTGQASRPNSLLTVITTAGKNIASPCHDLHDRAIKNLEDYTDLHDDALFAAIYGIDPEDDPYTVESLIKANPNYGVSIDLDYIQRRLNDAVKNVAKRNDFLTKHLNVWVSQKAAYFDILKWQELKDPNLDIEEFTNCDCFMSVDMSAKYDLTVITTLFLRIESDRLKHLYVFQDTYLPEGTLEDTENPNYKRYQTYAETDSKNTLSGKLLTVTPGAEIDTDFIQMEIETKIKKYNALQELVFDAWQARPLINSLSKKFPKLPIVDMQMTAKNLSPGMKEISGAMMSDRIHHDGNGILTWNMQNVESKTDKNDNEFPTNQNPKLNKKDGAVTLIMCASRSENYQPKVNMSRLIMNGGGFRMF